MFVIPHLTGESSLEGRGCTDQVGARHSIVESLTAIFKSALLQIALKLAPVYYTYNYCFMLESAIESSFATQKRRE